MKSKLDVTSTSVIYNGYEYVDAEFWLMLIKLSSIVPPKEYTYLPLKIFNKVIVIYANICNS